MGSTRKRRRGSCDQTTSSVLSGAGEDALSNHVVLKGIFQLLDTKTLLELSVVSKVWCSAARLVLRSQRRCLAGIKGIKPCKELLQLNQLLDDSYEHPFSGLAIRMQRGETAHQCMDSNESNYDGENNGTQTLGNSGQPPTSQYSAVLDKITFRHLEIDWATIVSCPAERLIETILKGKREEVVEMTILCLPESITSLKEHLGFTESSWLPKLKVLDFRSSKELLIRQVLVHRHEQAPRLKYELIQAAPQLQKYLGFSGIMDLKFFLDNGKLSIIKNYFLAHLMRFITASDDANEYVPSYFRGKQIEMMNFVRSEPKLTKLTIYDSNELVHGDPNDVAYETMLQMLRPLFQSISSSLEETSLTQSEFLHFIPKIISLPLRVLKILKLGVSTHIDQRLGFPSLERFDWGGLFPVLQTVAVRPFNRGFSREPHITNGRGVNIEETLRENLTCQPVSSCRTVEKITFELDTDLSGLEYFRTLFPNVKEFVCRLNTGLYRVSVSSITPPLGQILEYLWVTWPQLEGIFLTHVPDEEVEKNLDAILCGVEATMDPGRAPTVQPSIMLLERLKILRIEILHTETCDSSGKRDTSNFLMTRKANDLAFARMPGLRIEVVRQCCAAGDRCDFRLEHLRPFVRLLEAEEMRAGAIKNVIPWL